MTKAVSKEKMPTTVGIIMDGNRRWAKERGLPTLEGHRRGYEKLREVMGWCKELDIPNLVVYAFSTENWNRASEEVGYLMSLFRTIFTRHIDEFKREGYALRFIGQRSRFDRDLRAMMDKAEEETAGGTNGTLYVALSYGGRAEILAAVNGLLADLERRGDEVTEEEFARRLWTSGMPDPDLIIRTGGEHRLSNFLPWQSTYSELFFAPQYWPAFERQHFEKILSDFAERDRRKGK